MSDNAQDRLPILIIPGFMSSGLEIAESSVRPDWKGARLWINLVSLGFQSIHFGMRSVVRAENDEEDEETAKKHVEYKSAWLTHMSLQPDLQTEREGIKVRAIPGLPGVDYLTPGALTNHVSYVFGPVINALEKAGYTPERDLDAASYDWRLPPTQMEKRDGFFTGTIKQVEDLYKNNSNTPVVLLCHSLGCKVGHYFLNFCLERKGQAWIDQHIHTYLPVGAPHLGAPRAVRSLISGTKMSLDAFLDDQEALCFGRTLGSGPWLVPNSLPRGAPSNAFVQPHGTLRVRVVSPLNVESMLRNRKALSISRRLKLSIQYGETNVTTDFHDIDMDSGTITFPETFIFRTEEKSVFTAPQPQGQDDLHVTLLEPGASSTKQEKQSWVSCLMSLPYRILCCPCYLLGCVVRNLTVVSAEAAVRAWGGTSVLAASQSYRVAKLSPSSTSKTISVNMYYGSERETQESSFRCCFQQPCAESFDLALEWKPAGTGKSKDKLLSIAIKDDETVDPSFTSKDYKGTGTELLELEGLETMLQTASKIFDSDKLDPRGSVTPPPVKRIRAIYGTNLPTEVGAVYCHKAGMIDKGKLDNYYELDSSAKLAGKSSGYVLKKGILEETKDAKQFTKDGETTTVSGDGTVPYYSLQHVRNWNSDSCRVDVTEIEGAEHREILADQRFHEAIIEYCTTEKVAA